MAPIGLLTRRPVEFGFSGLVASFAGPPLQRILRDGLFLNVWERPSTLR